MKSFLAISSFLFFGLLVASTSNPVVAQDSDGGEPKPSNVRIENSRTGADLQLNELVDSLSQSDVIFLGEKHDNDSGHKFQLDVIKGLVKSGKSIAISTEQFERDAQGSLNDYLSGHLDEDEFLKTSSPWKNYHEHYRPIIEFAKENKIPVIAGNIPRRIASLVSQGKQPAVEDEAFMPRQLNSTPNAYWKKFKATMEGHMGADGESKMQLFFASQCLKDDAMAESITDWMAVNTHEAKIIVHLCGHFHSDYGLGTVERVLQRRPLTRFSVVTMESSKNAKEKQTLASLGARSHYTVWTVENKKPEDTKQTPVKENVKTDTSK